MGAVVILCGLIMLPLLLDVLALAFYGLLCFLGYLIRFLAICIWQAVLAACRGVWFCVFLVVDLLARRSRAVPEEPVNEWSFSSRAEDWQYYAQFNLNDPPPQEEDREEEEPAPEPEILPPATYDEALALLGLAAEFTQLDLTRAYKGAIRKAHPDVGGSKEKAQAVNVARDLLARRRGWR